MLTACVLRSVWKAGQPSLEECSHPKDSKHPRSCMLVRYFNHHICIMFLFLSPCAVRTKSTEYQLYVHIYTQTTHAIDSHHQQHPQSRSQWLIHRDRLRIVGCIIGCRGDIDWFQRAHPAPFTSLTSNPGGPHISRTRRAVVQQSTSIPSLHVDRTFLFSMQKQIHNDWVNSPCAGPRMSLYPLQADVCGQVRRGQWHA